MTRVITFYSYKGGTGRSMALANIAWILASAGNRVLTIDWDLEAPGLHRYFHPFLTDKELSGQESQGVIDMVVDFAVRAATPVSTERIDWHEQHADFSKWRQRLRWPSGDALRLGSSGTGSIDFVPAGRQGPDYARRVNHFDWRNFYEKLGGGIFFDAAKRNLAAYDYVLIDSRTGVSDTSGICTVHMPDTLVVCFTLNHQSIKGALAVAQSVKEQRPSIRIFPVPTRIDGSEEKLLSLMKNYAATVFSPLLDPSIDSNQYWYSMEVPYFARYAYAEKLALFEEQSSITASTMPAMERLCGYLTDGAVRSPGPLPEEERTRTLAEFEGGDQRQPTVAARNCIYISYRRDDAPVSSGRLYDWLRIAFGSSRVLCDVELAVGRPFENIDAALSQSSVCVTVIGPNWANAENLTRLADPADFLRHELETALVSAELTVVPTLVAGAELPLSSDLPPALRPLFGSWSYRRLSEENWEDDTQRLIGEVAEGCGLVVSPDLETLVRDASATRHHIARLEQADRLRADQIEALIRTVDQLVSKLAEATSGERERLVGAIATLGKGDTRAAEHAFEHDYGTEKSSAVSQAASARNVANLALLHDFDKATTFYRHALNWKWDHETARLLGEALLLSGDLPNARSILSQSLKAAIAEGDSLGQLWAHIALGDACLQQGDLDEAATAYAEVRELLEHQVRSSPARNLWQRERLRINAKIGDVLALRGDSSGALAAYQESVSLVEALAARDPTYSQWQGDLSAGYRKIGDARITIGDRLGALSSYRKSADLREALAKREPANVELQKDLMESRVIIGDVLARLGDRASALTAYHSSLELPETLIRQDADNELRQRDIHRKIGDIRTQIARKRQLTIMGSIVFFLVGLVAAGSAYLAAEAQRVALAQQQSGFLARAAQLAFERGDSDVSLALAIEAMTATRSGPFPAESERIVRLVVQQSTPRSAILSHQGSVYGARFSADGTRVVTASADRTARLWEAASGRELAVLRGHEDAVNGAMFSPDGARVVTSSRDATARLWEATSGKQLVILRGHEAPVSSALFSPDGKRVLSASSDRTARLWDVANGKELIVLRGHEGPVLSAVFSPDGRRVLTASSDRTARVWEVGSGKELLVLRGHVGPVLSAVFSADGSRVLTGSEDATARLWDTARGQELVILQGHTGAVDDAIFSPDGSRVLTGSEDRTARLWESASGKMMAVLRGHSGRVVGVMFSADGALALTASADWTARLWQANEGSLLTVFGSKGSVWSADFSPDDTRILIASSDWEASLFLSRRAPQKDLVSVQQLLSYACSILPKPLTREERRQYFLEDNPKVWPCGWPPDTKEKPRAAE